MVTTARTTHTAAICQDLWVEGTVFPAGDSVERLPDNLRWRDFFCMIADLQSI
jgi:hypothetical protein